jgi:hypothetical protein
VGRHGGANQQWKFDANGSIVGIGGMCLDIPNKHDVSGQTLQIWDCNGTAAQSWSFDAAGGSDAGAMPLGCFADSSNRDLPHLAYQNGSNTTEACIAACKAAGYAYAGTQYSTQCFCGNSYGGQGVSTQCTMSCSGDASEICGGPWSNTVYATGAGGSAVNGSCGSANGVAVADAPSTNLCNSGSPSSVTGTGPWSWTCAGSNGGTGASCSAPVLDGGSSPTVIPGNAVVHLTPSQGIPSTLSSNTTYMLGSGTYNNVFSAVPASAMNIQIIGAGAGSTIVNGGDTSNVDGQRRYIFNGGNIGFRGQNISRFEVWNLTADCGGGTYGPQGLFYGQGSGFVFQNLDVRNYSSTLKGQELFVIANSNPLDGNGNEIVPKGSGAGILVNNSTFTPASHGNVDGVTVLGMSWAASQVSNNTFNPPTDQGTPYYHCTGWAAIATGNTYTGPSFNLDESGFFYVEPGNVGQPTTAASITNNMVNLNNHSTGFVDIQSHSNATSPIFAPITVTGNTIINGTVMAVWGSFPSGTPIQNVTIQHNHFTNVTVTNFNGAASSDVITSPNP